MNYSILMLLEAVENVVMQEDLSLRPRITVIGIGGAGGNAVNNMIRAQLEGVDFLVANTDAQSLNQSLVAEVSRLQLGPNITKGLGAGSKPDIGHDAAEESALDILPRIQNSNMVFITAGMGGGTGTGAAPVIARIARDAGILTVGVVTKPFYFEGAKRAVVADKGIEELKRHVDTLIIIPNQNLFRIANEQTTFADAFKMADEVLYSGVRGVTDLMIMPGLINLDFADVRAVMAEMGNAMMGTGESTGERRALDAAEAAIANPLLDDVSLRGARGVLISITGGKDMTLFEVDEATNRIREDVDADANIIFGATFDERLDGRIRVSVVATGIGMDDVKKMEQEPSTHINDDALLVGVGGVIRNTLTGNQVFSANNSLYSNTASGLNEPAQPDPSANNTFVSNDLSQHENVASKFVDEPRTNMRTGSSLSQNFNQPKKQPEATSPKPKERQSLLDRLTRTSRRVSSESVRDKEQQNNDANLESLEIPAFLRRDSKK